MTKDILVNSDKELIIQEGDFVIDVSEEEHIEAILISEKGHWKESPMVGVGIISAVNSSGQLAGLEREINVQLMLDEWQNINIDLSDIENIEVEANKLEDF